MSTSTIAIQVPVAIDSEDITVEATLFRAPDEELHRALGALSFQSARYPDIRVGKAHALTQVHRLAEEAGNHVWRTRIPFAQRTRAVLGDILTHVRVFIPDALSAELVGTVELVRDAPVTTVNGQCIAWGRAEVTVSA